MLSRHERCDAADDADVDDDDDSYEIVTLMVVKVILLTTLIQTLMLQVFSELSGAPRNYC